MGVHLNSYRIRDEGLRFQDVLLDPISPTTEGYSFRGNLQKSALERFNDPVMLEDIVFLRISQAKEPDDISILDAFPVCCAVNDFPEDEIYVTDKTVYNLLTLTRPVEAEFFQKKIQHFVFTHRELLHDRITHLLKRPEFTQ